MRQLTNVEADVAASYDYLPYGKEVGSSTAPLQFTGHERDSHGPGDEDNLDYMHARYYSPHLSRFIAVDPVLGEPAMPQSWNRYAYSLNNPVNYVDPTGLATYLLIAGEGFLATDMQGQSGDVGDLFMLAAQTGDVPATVELSM